MRRPTPLVAVSLLPLLLLALPARPARADFETAKQLFLEKVKSPEWKSRRTAYGALSDHDGEASARLILDHLAGEPNAVVLATGADALARFRSMGARKVLLEGLSKGKPAERLLSAYGLKDDRSPEVDAALVAALAGPGPTAAQAALSLSTKGRGSTVVPALVKALAADAWQVRVAAARSLSDLGAQEAVAPLVLRLKTERGRAREEVVRALQAITGKKIGDAPKTWEAIAAGQDPSTVTEKPALPPTFFGIPVTGERVVFVLDKSLLMADPHPFQGDENRERLEALCSPPDGDRIPWRRIKSKLQLAVAHLIHAVNGMPAGSKVEVVTFCKEVKGVFEGKWTSVSTAARKTLSEALAAIEVDDGIDLWTALTMALDLGGTTDEKAWKQGPEQVFLVTNNVPTAGDVQDGDLLGNGIGLKARLRMVPIHAVGIGNHPFGLAEAITKRSGGTYVNLTK